MTLVASDPAGQVMAASAVNLSLPDHSVSWKLPTMNGRTENRQKLQGPTPQRRAQREWDGRKKDMTRELGTPSMVIP